MIKGIYVFFEKIWKNKMKKLKDVISFVLQIFIVFWLFLIILYVLGMFVYLAVIFFQFII